MPLLGTRVSVIPCLKFVTGFKDDSRFEYEVEFASICNPVLSFPKSSVYMF